MLWTRAALCWPFHPLPTPASCRLQDWDSDFVKDFTNPKLFDLIQAANYMNIKDLLDLTCQRVADMIRVGATRWSLIALPPTPSFHHSQPRSPPQGKTPEELRRLFNIDISSEFTPEEAEEVKREGLWTW